MGVPQWSRAPARNDNADPTVPASSSMTGRQVSEAIRGVMAATRAFADDQGGAIETTGEGNAYVAHTASGVAALRPGLRLTLRTHRLNTGSPTLLVDGIGPKPWIEGDGSQIGGGRIFPDRFYDVVYDDDRDVWRMQSGVVTVTEGFVASNVLQQVLATGDNVELNRAAAERARGGSEAASLDAKTARAQAQDSALQADQSRADAATAANTAVTARTAAVNAKTDAETAQGLAQTARTMAEAWATQVDTEVVTARGFGAKKYALDAAQAATRAETVVGQVASGGTVPGLLATLVTGSDIVDVRFYDVGRDSDGGAWRQRAGGTSWQLEQLNTAQRGVRKEFPRRSVLTLRSGSDGLLIQDIDQLGSNALPSLWKRIPVTAGGLLDGVPARVMVLQGAIYVSSTTGLYRYDFALDRATRWDSTGRYFWTGGLAAGGTGVWAQDGANYAAAALLADAITGIAGRTIPGGPTNVAGLTIPTLVACSAAGLSFIRPDGSAVGITVSGGYNRVAFASDTRVVASRASGIIIDAGPIPTVGSTQLIWRTASYTNATVPAGLGAGNPTGLAVLPSTGGLGPIIAWGNSSGATFLIENPAVPSAGMVAYATNGFATPWQQGAVGLCLDGASLTDRSVNPRAVGGAATFAAVATGSDLQATTVTTDLTVTVTAGGTLYGWRRTGGRFVFCRSLADWGTDATLVGTALTIKAGCVFTRLVYTNGAPSTAQLDRIERDDRALFEPGAKMLLSGASSSLFGVSADADRGVIGLASSQALDEFAGMRRSATIAGASTTFPGATNSSYRNVALRSGIRLLVTAAGAYLARDVKLQVDDSPDALGGPLAGLLANALPIADDDEAKTATRARVATMFCVNQHIMVRGLKSILDFGPLVGLGNAAADTAAFQAMAASNGNEIRFPIPEIGYYRINGVVTLPGNVHMVSREDVPVFCDVASNGAPYTGNIIQMNGASNLCHGFNFIAGNTTTNYQFFIGSDADATPSDNHFEKIKVSNTNGGLKIFGARNFVEDFTCEELRGTAFSIVGDNASHNTLEKLRIRNGAAAGIFLDDGAHHNTVRDARKYVDPTKYTQLQHDNVRAEFKQHMLDGFYGGDILTQKARNNFNEIYDIACSGTRDGCLTLNGNYNLVVGAMFENTTAGACYIIGSYNTVEGLRVDNCKYGVAFGSAFGGLGIGNQVVTPVVRNCFEYGYKTVQAGIKLYVANEDYKDDAPAYVGYNNGVTFNTYQMYAVSYAEVNGVKQYKAGNNPPVHNAGTVSDGLNMLEFLSSVPVSELGNSATPLPRKNALIGPRAENNAIADYAGDGLARAHLRDATGSNGAIGRNRDIQPSRLKRSAEDVFHLLCTTTDATPTPLTFDGNLPVYRVVTSGGGSGGFVTAFSVGSSTALPPRTAVSPLFAIEFHANAGARPTFDDGSGDGPLELVQADGTSFPAYSAGPPAVGIASNRDGGGNTVGVIRRFTKRTGLVSIPTTGRPTNRNAYILVPSTDWPVNGLSIQDTAPVSYTVRGTVTASEEAGANSATWDYSYTAVRGATTGAISIVGLSKALRTSTAGAAGWDFDVIAVTSTNPLPINVQPRAIGAVGKTIKWTMDGTCQ